MGRPSPCEVDRVQLRIGPIRLSWNERQVSPTWSTIEEALATYYVKAAIHSPSFSLG